MVRFAVGIAFLGASAVAAVARPEHNAFLDWSVTSAAALRRELGADPRVLDRYERHFGLTKSTLERWFSGLHVKRLTLPTKFWVYNVDKAGVIRRKLLTLRAGTAILVDANGKPILKLSCGNPLAPGSDSDSRPETPLAMGSPHHHQPMMVEESSDAAPAHLLSLSPAPLPALVEATLTPESPAIAPFVSTPVPAPPINISAATFVPTALVPAVGLIGVVGGLGGSHSPRPHAVPEPSGGLVIAGGLAATAVSRRWRRSRPFAS